MIRATLERLALLAILAIIVVTLLALAGCTPATEPTCSTMVADTLAGGTRVSYGVCLGNFR